jgi:hypothetical protein
MAVLRETPGSLDCVERLGKLYSLTRARQGQATSNREDNAADGIDDRFGLKQVDLVTASGRQSVRAESASRRWP